MAVRKIRTSEDDFLRKKSRPVDKIDARTLSILGDLADTMYDDNGLGLAAVQVGILRRLIYIDVTPVLRDDIAELDRHLAEAAAAAADGKAPEELNEKLTAEKRELERMLAYGPLELVNPEIIAREGEESDVEGCLSVPGYQGNVRRPVFVKVKSLDAAGRENIYEATGVLKKAFCHEIDHLDGILYTDIADKVYRLDEE